VFLLELSAAIHVVGVVIWIGGVAFVTIILFPMIQEMENPLEKALLFQKVEHRFARLVRVVIVVVGITGAYNLHARGLYSIMTSPEGFWLDLMIGVYAVYALLIFGLEKALFKRIFKETQNLDADRIFRHMSTFHWVVLTFSLLAVAGGVMGNH